MEYTIRPATGVDIDAIVGILGGWLAAVGTLNNPYESPELRRKRMENPQPGSYNLVACTSEGEVIGHLGLHANPRPRRSHAADLGMAVRDDWQGKGVGSALLAAACDLADRWLPLTRIELIVYTDNARAIALYEKFGFEREGLLRRYALRDGHYVDAYSMARLRPSTL